MSFSFSKVVNNISRQSNSRIQSTIPSLSISLQQKQPFSLYQCNTISTTSNNSNKPTKQQRQNGIWKFPENSTNYHTLNPFQFKHYFSTQNNETEITSGSPLSSSATIDELLNDIEDSEISGNFSQNKNQERQKDNKSRFNGNNSNSKQQKQSQSAKLASTLNQDDSDSDSEVSGSDISDIDDNTDTDDDSDIEEIEISEDGSDDDIEQDIIDVEESDDDEDAAASSDNDLDDSDDSDDSDSDLFSSDSDSDDDDDDIFTKGVADRNRANTGNTGGVGGFRGGNMGGGRNFGGQSQSQSQGNEMGSVSQDRLILKSLNFYTSRTDLWELCSEFGNVTNVQVPMNRENTNMNRGFAFVTFASNDDAMNALNKLQNYEFQSRFIKAEFAIDRRNSNNNSFGGNDRFSDNGSGFRGRQQSMSGGGGTPDVMGLFDDNVGSSRQSQSRFESKPKSLEETTINVSNLPSFVDNELIEKIFSQLGIVSNVNLTSFDQCGFPLVNATLKLQINENLSNGQSSNNNGSSNDTSGSFDFNSILNSNVTGPAATATADNVSESLDDILKGTSSPSSRSSNKDNVLASSTNSQDLDDLLNDDDDEDSDDDDDFLDGLLGSDDDDDDDGSDSD